MEKKTLLVFTKNNTRIFTNPDPILLRAATFHPACVVDPDIKAVWGLPPHYWKLDGKNIVPMSELEMELRDKQIQDEGVDNDVSFLFKNGTLTPSVPGPWYCFWAKIKLFLRRFLYPSQESGTHLK